jgi:hypothetical protein
MLLGMAGINIAYFGYKLKYLEGNMWATGAWEDVGFRES